MRVSEFDYSLPPELIAQVPLPRRDSSRMMIVDRRNGTIRHGFFGEFPSFFGEDDLLVLNDTKVLPVRLWGESDKGKIEFLLTREMGGGLWESLCRPARKVGKGDLIRFAPGFEAEVVGTGKEGIRLLRFDEEDIRPELHHFGFAPLPPYIKRRQEDLTRRGRDLERYQTVFARKEGAVAAPTAGLHFTDDILKRLRAASVRICRITLDVGLATFQPVRTAAVEDHKMLTERYSIPPAAAEEINTAKAEKRPVTAIGTTVVRTLETASPADKPGARIKAGKGESSLFIFPGYEFRIVDRLLTNFHLPKSTLLMLVSAFCGHELVMEAYREAVKEKYRFYSYGDCMFIL